MTVLLNGQAVKVGARLDQRHGDARIDPLEEAGAGRACKAAAHDHDPAAGTLRDGGQRQHRRRVRRRAACLRKSRRLVCVVVMIGSLNPSARRTRRRWP